MMAQRCTCVVLFCVWGTLCQLVRVAALQSPDGETGCSNVKGQLSAWCLISLSYSCTDVLYATLSFAPAGVHSGAAGWTEQLNTLSGQDHMQERSVHLCTYRQANNLINRALFCIHVCTVYYAKNCSHVHTYTVYCYWTLRGENKMEHQLNQLQTI